MDIGSKNYWNQTTTVKIIPGDWAVYFFETQRRTATIFISGYAITLEN